MSEAVLVPRGGGEVIGDSPWRRVEILADHETLAATWSRFGPHRDGADLHVHELHTDLFYVLDGLLTFRLGTEDEHRVVPAGTLVCVPPLVVHGFRNASDADVSYLNLHAPGQRFAEYLRALRDRRSFSYDQHDPPADGGRPVDEVAIGESSVVVDQPGLRVAMLADVEEITVAETWCAAGDTPVTSAAVERDRLDSIYVLEGALTFNVADRVLRAESGSWVQTPPGVSYAAAAGDGDARFLTVKTPGRGRASGACPTEVGHVE